MSGRPEGPSEPVSHKRTWTGKYKSLPFGSDEELRVYQTYRVTLRTIRRLAVLKKKLGFRSLEATIAYMINISEREGLIPPASYQMVFVKAGTRPCILTGESGSGKTTTMKNLLQTFTESKEAFGQTLKPGNALIIDVHDEYGELGFRKIDLGKFFGMEWEKEEGARIRFVPNPNVMISKAEASTIFSHLNFIKNSGALKTWCIVIEEGHRFSDDTNLRALLIEARKFVRKLIIVTTDWKVYADIAAVFKPIPWEPVSSFQPPKSEPVSG